MTTHKNQVGQDGTGVNGGEFAKKAQSDDNVTLTSPVRTLSINRARDLRRTAALAEQMLSAAASAADRLSIIEAKDELREMFPGAVRAYVRKTDDYDAAWSVHRVIDGEGNAVFDEYGMSSDWQQLLEINNLIGGVEGYWNFDQDADDELIADAESDPSVYMQLLDLTKTVKDIPTTEDLLGLTALGREEQDELLRTIANVTGETTIPSGKTEFEYLLTHDATSVGVAPDTLANLEEKFGGREEALQALISTRAYTDFQEEAADALQYNLRRATEYAIKEALTS